MLLVLLVSEETVPSDLKHIVPHMRGRNQRSLGRTKFAATKTRNRNIGREQLKPLFTVHAGEFLVGCEIEKRYPRVNVWLPAKDTGVDFLLTDKDNTRILSLQVKFSRDYLATHLRQFGKTLRACGWWTPTRHQLDNSRAEYWVFVLFGFGSRSAEFIFIKPSELRKRMNAIHGPTLSKFQSYLWVTHQGKCFETRGLSRHNQQLVADGQFSDEARDFSAYLNNWAPIQTLNGLTA